VFYYSGEIISKLIPTAKIMLAFKGNK